MGGKDQCKKLCKAIQRYTLPEQIEHLKEEHVGIKEPRRIIVYALSSKSVELLEGRRQVPSLIELERHVVIILPDSGNQVESSEDGFTSQDSCTSEDGNGDEKMDGKEAVSGEPICYPLWCTPEYADEEDEELDEFYGWDAWGASRELEELDGYGEWSPADDYPDYVFGE